jgi:Protein of unknown function (DUF3108)
MARWLIPLSVALLLALAVHGIVLWGIGQQLQAMTSVIVPHADPLWTRQITQQAGPSGLPSGISVPKQAPAQQSIALAAIKNIAKNTPSKSTTESAVVEPALPESTPTLALGTATETTTASITPHLATSTLAEAGTASQAVTATAATAPADATPPAASDAGTDSATALALQGQWPGDTRLSYQVGGYFRGDLHGDAQVQWTRPPGSTAQPSDRYQVRINISLGLAKAQMASQGRVGVAGLQPQAYEEQLPNGGRRSVTLDSRDVQLTDGRRIPRPADDPSLVQDTASQFVDLGYRFSTGRAVLKPGETIRVWLARPGGLDEWVYDIGPAETLYLPIMGAVQAYHLKPRPLAAARGTITAEMWIAPGLQHLPVRIKITLNKDAHLDLLVLKIEQR